MALRLVEMVPAVIVKYLQANYFATNPYGTGFENRAGRVPANPGDHSWGGFAAIRPVRVPGFRVCYGCCVWFTPGWTTRRNGVPTTELPRGFVVVVHAH